MIAGFVRGLSVRDVENTLADALGAEAALSKSTVSRICQAIGDEFTAWSGRRLDGLELDYLFLDASMFKMHPGARAEPVLAAWGITTDGKPVFVALAAGGSESTDAWAGFLDELRGRGLRPPLLVISDGAAGLISAIETRAGPVAAAKMPDPPMPQRAGQGPRRRARRDPGRLLGDLRHRGPDRRRRRARARTRHRRAGPHRRLRPAPTASSTPPPSSACSPTASS